jgi:hypothetical protein
MSLDMTLPKDAVRKYNCMTGAYEWTLPEDRKRIHSDKARENYIIYLEEQTQQQARQIAALQAGLAIALNVYEYCLLICIPEDKLTQMQKLRKMLPKKASNLMIKYFRQLYLNGRAKESQGNLHPRQG